MIQCSRSCVSTVNTLSTLFYPFVDKRSVLPVCAEISCVIEVDARFEPLRLPAFQAAKWAITGLQHGLQQGTQSLLVFLLFALIVILPQAQCWRN